MWDWEVFQSRIIEVAARSTDPDQNSVGTNARNLERNKFSISEVTFTFPISCHWTQAGMPGDWFRCLVLFSSEGSWQSSQGQCSALVHSCLWLYWGPCPQRALAELSWACLHGLGGVWGSSAALNKEQPCEELKSMLTFFPVAALILPDRTGAILTFKCHCQQ